jgi:hypothetical protein
MSSKHSDFSSFEHGKSELFGYFYTMHSIVGFI